jgi:hypothetical protein
MFPVISFTHQISGIFNCLPTLLWDKKGSMPTAFLIQTFLKTNAFQRNIKDSIYQSIEKIVNKNHPKQFEQYFPMVYLEAIL